MAKRVELLERTMVKSLQYNRRESIEIHGLPETIKDENLEGKCLDLLGEIGCGHIQPSQVQACHRLKNRNKTIIRFVNSKHANAALHNKKKLKEVKKENYGLPKEDKIFINESLCRPFGFLAYVIRKALASKSIESYNIWKGKITLKVHGVQHYISHIQDLIDLNLANEEDRINFYHKNTPLFGYIYI